MKKVLTIYFLVAAVLWYALWMTHKASVRITRMDSKPAIQKSYCVGCEPLYQYSYSAPYPAQSDETDGCGTQSDETDCPVIQHHVEQKGYSYITGDVKGAPDWSASDEVLDTKVVHEDYPLFDDGPSIDHTSLSMTGTITGEELHIADNPPNFFYSILLLGTDTYPGGCPWYTLTDPKDGWSCVMTIGTDHAGPIWCDPSTVDAQGHTLLTCHTYPTTVREQTLASAPREEQVMFNPVVKIGPWAGCVPLGVPKGFYPTWDCRAWLLFGGDDLRDLPPTDPAYDYSY